MMLSDSSRALTRSSPRRAELEILVISYRMSACEGTTRTLLGRLLSPRLPGSKEERDVKREEEEEEEDGEEEEEDPVLLVEGDPGEPGPVAELPDPLDDLNHKTAWRVPGGQNQEGGERGDRKGAGIWKGQPAGGHGQRAKGGGVGKNAQVESLPEEERGLRLDPAGLSDGSLAGAGGISDRSRTVGSLFRTFRMFDEREKLI